MYLIKSLLFSTIFSLIAFGSLRADELRKTPTMLDFISLWLQSEYQLGKPGGFPEIISVPAEQLLVRRYGQRTAASTNEVIALYDDQAGVILVSDSWSGQSASDLSVLVHEMVHHMQHEAGTVFACPAEREKMAYHAQEEFLNLFGLSLESAFGIDPAIILVATACVQ